MICLMYFCCVYGLSFYLTWLPLFLRDGRGFTAQQAGLGSGVVLLGGAIGNLIDRIFRSPGFLRGAVVDFVHVGRWPTFNVSDSAITIGAIIVVVWSVRSSARERHVGTSPGDTAGDTEGG